MLVSKKALYNLIINCTNVPADRRVKLTHYCLHIYFCFYRQMFVLKKAICNLITNFTKVPAGRWFQQTHMSCRYMYIIHVCKTACRQLLVLKKAFCNSVLLNHFTMHTGIWLSQTQLPTDMYNVHISTNHLPAGTLVWFVIRLLFAFFKLSICL